MKRDDIHRFLQIAGWPIKDKGEWVQTRCPFAGMRHGGGEDNNPSLGISVHDDSESRYNCLACGSKGRLIDLPTTLSFMSDDQRLWLPEARAHVAATEIFSGEDQDEGYLVEMAPSIFDDVLKRFRKIRKSHIKKRSINEAAVHELEIMLDHEENRMVYPIRDEDQRLVGIRGRFLGNADLLDVPKYKEYVELSPSRSSVKKFGIWYGECHVPRRDKAAVLVEGDIDRMLMWQEFPRMNVLCSMGASITKTQLAALEKFPAIICFFDDDDAGRNALYAVSQYWHGRKPLYKVVNYHGLKDPGELYEAGKLRDALENGVARI